MKTKYPPLATVAVGGLFVLINQAFAQTWTQTSAPSNSWSSIASSADGTRLVAVADGGGIYTSADSGATWRLTSAPITNWSSVASSASGTNLVALTGRSFSIPGPIYISADSGGTWVQTTAPSMNWTSVASSADGTRLAAGGYGTLFMSTNSGATWTPNNAPSAGPTCVTSSADGTRLFLATGLVPGRIYTSVDLGATWSQHSTSVDVTNWTSVVSSADGAKLAAAGWPNDPVFTSMNSGATWIVSWPQESSFWLAASADGSRLVTAGSRDRGIFISTNWGATWTEMSAPITNWSSVASSADGSKLVAVVDGGGVYTSQSTPAPLLNVVLSGGSRILSWTVPSMPFVLQENSNLSPTNWTEVPTIPTLNFANLRNQVIVSPSASKRFYRLKH